MLLPYYKYHVLAVCCPPRFSVLSTKALSLTTYCFLLPIPRSVVPLPPPVTTHDCGYPAPTAALLLRGPCSRRCYPQLPIPSGLPRASPTRLTAAAAHGWRLSDGHGPRYVVRLYGTAVRYCARSNPGKGTYSAKEALLTAAGLAVDGDRPPPAGGPPDTRLVRALKHW